MEDLYQKMQYGSAVLLFYGYESFIFLDIMNLWADLWA